jgi:hypothetical protein
MFLFDWIGLSHAQVIYWVRYLHLFVIQHQNLAEQLLKNHILAMVGASLIFQCH